MKKEHAIKFSGREIPFPAVINISFAALFESLRKQSKDDDKPTAAFATALLEELAPYPELETGFTDAALLKKYAAPIAQLLRPLFPDILSENEIKAVSAPFQFQPFFTSKRFQRILEAAGEDFPISVMDYSEDEIYIFVCCVILTQVYQYPVDLSTPFKLTIPDKRDETTHIYRVAFNADMIRVVATPSAPAITPEDYSLLINNFRDIHIWKKKFPPGSYIMNGIGIINLMDITVDESIEGITANLLSKSTDIYAQISAHLKTIFKKPGLQVGYINFENDAFRPNGQYKKASGVVLNKITDKACEALCPESYEKLVHAKEPLVITDTAVYAAQHESELSAELLKAGIGSYIIIPLIYDGQLLGFIELAAEKPYELSMVSVVKIAAVLPVLSMALSHFRTESRNEIEAVIQQEFTQIHPSVKWRFEQEARAYIDKKRVNRELVLKDLDFQKVYPLYGQLDIKGSSLVRNQVIQKDFDAQLGAVQQILERAHQQLKLPLYEELLYRVARYRREIGEGLQAGTEHDILFFLRKDINPAFDHLEQSDKTFEQRIKKYRGMLDPQLNVIYQERRKFDQGIAMINKTLTDHLDKRQEEAQQIFPHYFERYKTDGIEYNMYAGESITHVKTFHKVYIHSLRLWQLMVMSELENKFYNIKGELHEPLEIASLILVQSDPLAIHFRLDEKRFDVKGAYNARYEIIKSRIDKAMIRGTGTRITAPGKLTIVYSNDEDAVEYARYLNFLSAKGYFIPNSMEKLIVEDLQGITGLQALRVDIQYPVKVDDKHLLNVVELMGMMEGG